MQPKIKVILVENDLDFVYLFRKKLSLDPDISFLGHATNKEDAIVLAIEVKPDIVLMDLNLTADELDGIDASKEIRLATKAKVIILSSYDNFDTVIQASIKSFASGYLFKSQLDQVIPTIKLLAKGHTPHEYMIKSLLINQLTNAEKSILDNMLGNEDYIPSSGKTIANQKTNIFRKLGVKNKKELIHLFRNTFT
ncbi:MAG: DNA-binding response regulator [Anaerocolumna sp.]|jgi:DNA-binding NarL/FixJ family response regulator|nr:DNA-binding response regulator [Anaerocolumna sp.]